MSTHYDEPPVDEHDGPTLLPVIHASQLVNGFLAELELRRKYGKDAQPGEPTGLSELDQECIFDGGQLVVLGARQGVGKTALALQVALHIALRKSAGTGRGGKVLYVITEMSERVMFERAVINLAQLARKDLYRDVSDETISNAAKAASILAASGLGIVPAVGKSIDSIEATVRHFRSQDPDLRAVFVDNLTGVSKPHASRASDREDQWLGDIAKRLNTLAVDLNLPVWLLVHLKRAENRIPQESDIAGSDRVGRWADTTLLMHEKDGTEDRAVVVTERRSGFGTGRAVDPFDPVWSDGQGSPDSEATHELRAAKNRGGRKFTADLRFVGQHMRFEDPHGVTVRPFTVPAPESARVAEYRRERRRIQW